jgi:uncharacterized protein YlaI
MKINKSMKKFILLALTALTLNLTAQSNKKFNLVQHFSSTHEVNCLVRNADLYKTLDSLPGDFIHMQIHSTFPDTRDNFYQDVRGQNAIRTFYNVQSAPVVYINGVRGPLRIPILFTTDQIVKDNFSKLSEVGLKIVETGTNTNKTVKIDTKSFNTRAGTDIRLFAVVVQTTVDTVTFNAEKVQRNPIRTFLTDTNGLKITLPAVGSTITNTFTYNPTSKPYWDPARLKVIAWIQDFTTKAIINAGNVSLTTDNDDILSDTNVEVYPNPTFSDLNIDMYNGLNIQDIKVYSIDGKLMLNENLNTKKLSSHIINVSNLNTGLYILRINTEEGIITKKFNKI